uniref:WH1 domain-containing protein n=1 Tax=Elaeophora elaphi TaxID=1147741 RepID=A0A0R3RYC8_9BILA
MLWLHILECKIFSESTVAVAMADVMMYDDSTKQWLSPDGSSEAARSQVRILHNVHTNAFRIVGTRLQDGHWILNCNIYERLRYKPATPTFHQWRDEKRTVYGLSFMKEEDARLFVKVMTQALSLLTSSNDYQNGSDLGFSNTIYQEPHQLHHNVYSSPSFRGADDESLCSGGGSPAQNMNNFRLVFF